jgi:methyl-accepting chemotaxis protein
LTENLSVTCEEIAASTEEQLASVEEVNNLSMDNREVANKLAQIKIRFKTIE